MRLVRYVIRRLLFLIPVLLGALFLTFLLTRMVPGNPIERVAGPYASNEAVEEMKALGFRGHYKKLLQFVRYWSPTSKKSEALTTATPAAP